MNLSDEQTAAANHGIGRRAQWEEIERPTGTLSLPTWIRDVHVDWAEGYGNAPGVTFKTVGEEWPQPVFRKDGSAYIAEHSDGRLQIHYHNGKVAKQKMKVFRSQDGTIRQSPRFGREWGEQDGIGVTYPDGKRGAYEPGEWVEMEMRATTQDEGYAGRHFWLMMDDGEWLILRGPWRGGAPKGWTCIYTVACDEPDAWIARKGWPWWRRTACYGTELRDDVFIAAMSKFAPHIPLARVTYSYGSYIEPFMSEWGEPKTFWLEKKRAA